jgi:hypothetical protein
MLIINLCLKVDLATGAAQSLGFDQQSFVPKARTRAQMPKTRFVPKKMYSRSPGCAAGDSLPTAGAAVDAIAGSR